MAQTDKGRKKEREREKKREREKERERERKRAKMLQGSSFRRSMAATTPKKNCKPTSLQVSAAPDKK